MEQIRVIKEMREHDRRVNGRTDEHIRPRYMVWENVPGAFSSNKGEDFRAVLEETAKVAKGDACIPGSPGGKWPHAGCIMGDGWSIAWRLHDAQFWGVPQRRKRIALVADFGGTTAPEILFERKGMSGDIEESGETGEGAATDTTRSIETTSKHQVNEWLKAVNSEAKHQQDLIQSDLGVARTLAPGTHASGSHLTKTLVTNIGQGAATDSERSVNKIGPRILNPYDSQGNQVADSDGVYPTLRGCGGAGYQQGYCLQHDIDTERGIDKAISFQERAEKPGGGKGILIQNEKTGALSTVNNQSIAYGFKPQQGAKAQGMGYQEEIAPTLNTSMNAGVMCLNDQGGQQMSVSEDVSGTLRAEEHGHQPIVYGISSFDSNAMKSSNPNSGIYEADTSRTLDLNGGNPACNQGGMAVVQGKPLTFQGQAGVAASLQIGEDVSCTLSCTKEAMVVHSAGVDGYNQTMEEEVAQPLRAADGGDSTPKVMVQGFDAYNQQVTGDVSKTLNAIKSDADHVPVIMQGADVYNGVLTGETAATLTSACGGSTTSGAKVVCIEGNGQRESHKGDGYKESDTMYTLNTVEQHAVAYRKTSHAKTADDGQGWQETDVNDTLNAFDSGESRTPTVIVEGFDNYNMSLSGEKAKTLQSEGGGSGVNEGCVLIENHPQDSRVKIREDGIVQTLDARMGTGGGNMPMVMEPTVFPDTAAARCAQDGRGGVHTQMMADPESNFVLEPYTSSKASYHQHFTNDGKAETLVASDYKDPPTVTYGLDRASYNQGQNAKFDFRVEEEKIGTQVAKGPGAVCQSVVRRLTPMECERLQGFPDTWTDIGDWVDSKGKKHKGESDSPRYKALGNSIALPYWSWMAEKMVKELNVEHPTMASLFDGISGFCLVYKRCGCEPVWTSEIEEFPIAVCKRHFGDETTGEKGDIDEYL